PDSARALGLRARLVVLPLYRGPTLFGRRFPMTTRSWINKLFARTPRTIRKAPARFRPHIETLEDRVTPSTFNVTNSNDDLTPGSLRWAIIQANANPGPDTIDTYQTTTIYDLTGQPIGTERLPLSINVTLAGTQLPTITDDLTIIGNDTFKVSGNNQSRVLNIDSGVTVNISDMTITNGFAPGGNATDLWGGYGGGIFNSGTLTITDST